MKRQLERFREGQPGPDFPGGEGEERHVGRPKQEDLTSWARRSMGLQRLEVPKGSAAGVERVVESANRIWGLALANGTSDVPKGTVQNI